MDLFSTFMGQMAFFATTLVIGFFAYKIKFIDDDFEDIVTIVTTLDAKPEDMLISIESDLGKALAGKRAGDVVEVMAPGESYKVEILEIL